MAAPATPADFVIDNRALTNGVLADFPANLTTLAAVRLAWSNPDATAVYRAQFKLSLDPTWIDGALSDVGADHVEIFGLENGGQYDFRVRGENADGDSAWAADAEEETMGTLIAASGDIVHPDYPPAAVTTDTTATITLTDTAGHEAAWQFFLYTWPAHDILFTGFFDTLSRVAVIPSLEPATTYALGIRTYAFSDAGILLNQDMPGEISFLTDAAAGGAGSGMTGPDEIEGHLFAGLAADFTLDPAPAGSATWSITGAPGGVTIDGTGTLNVTGRITGSPTASGLFDAIVFATWADGGEVQSASRAVRFLIAGGAFLPWLSGDASTVDLQADFATRTLTSSRAAADVLWLKRGDAFDPLVVFRDGDRILAPAITELRLRLRLADNSAAPPLVDIRTTPPAAEFFDGHRAYRLRGVLESPLITRLFPALGVASVACQLELSWKTAGKWASSKFLSVTLADDAIRH